jgi:hypothetical protein
MEDDMPEHLGNVLNALSEPAHNPVVDFANEAILDVHAALEGLGDETNLSGTTHGLTNLGETAGLGRIGGDNLITDVAHLPGDVLNGANPVTEVAGIVTDVGQTVSATGGLVQGLGTDLSAPNVISDVLNGVTGRGIPGGSTAGGNDHNISLNVGEGSPLLNLGVLATPDGTSPVEVDVGNGANVVNLGLLTHGGGILQFPDLGGAGTDSLTGLVSSVLGLGGSHDGTGDQPGGNNNPPPPAVDPGTGQPPGSIAPDSSHANDGSAGDIQHPMSQPQTIGDHAFV